MRRYQQQAQPVADQHGRIEERTNGLKTNHYCTSRPERTCRRRSRRVLAALATHPNRDELRAEYRELDDEDIRQALEYPPPNSTIAWWNFVAHEAAFGSRFATVDRQAFGRRWNRGGTLVVRIRIEGLKDDQLATILAQVIAAAAAELTAGAVVADAEDGIRVRSLPIGG